MGTITTMDDAKTAYETYRRDIEALSLDPACPIVEEDDPRFDQVGAILDQFDGVRPEPPLPPRWEGLRPLEYDGTLQGVANWLEREWRLIRADEVFCKAENISLLRLNRVIRNAHRAITDLGMEDPPRRLPKANEVSEATERIKALREFLRHKLREGWKQPRHAEAVCRSADGEARYIFKRESRKQWHIQFGKEPKTPIPHTANLLVYARLLANPGRPMNAFELVGERADLEREEKCIHAAKSGVVSDEEDECQIGTPDDAVDDDTINDVQNRIRDLPRAIEVARQKGDIEEVKTLEKELAWYHKYLNESVRDRPDKTSGRLRSRPLGSPALTETLRKRVSNNISRGLEDIRPYNSTLADYLLDKVESSAHRKATWIYDPKEELGWEVSWEF